MAAIVGGMYQAEVEQRNIDDETARRIASQLHGGQASAMYSLASCGAIDYESIRGELVAGYGQADPLTRRMWDHVGTYALEHDGRGPQEGWHELTADETRSVGAPAVQAEVEQPPRRPMVFVASLKAYNAGILHGDWVPIDRPPEDIWTDIHEIYNTSPEPFEEEYRVTDTDNLWGVHVHEYEIIDAVSRLGQLLAEKGQAFALYLNLEGGMERLDQAEAKFDDAYAGEYPTDEEAAHEMLDDAGVFAAVERAKAELPEAYADFIQVDVDGYIEMQPDVHFIRGLDSTFVFREI